MIAIKRRVLTILSAALCLAVLACMSGCGWLPYSRRSDDFPFDDSASETEGNFHSAYDGAQGSAGSMNGRTLMISIYTDDAGTSWDDHSSDDAEMMFDTLDNLRISTDYLTK